MADGAPVVRGLYRYPVKSMVGESLTECTVGPAGVVGDRGYALIDESDGKMASAKNPRKWGALLGFRAAYVDEPRADEAVPPVEITFPDGSVVRSDAADCDAQLSKALGRGVRLTAGGSEEKPSFEEVWPDIEGLAPDDFIEQTTIGHEESGEVVSDLPGGLFSPPGTFFDLSVIHLLTTATLARLTELAPEATFDVRRYRANFLLDDTGEGFVENDWVGRTLALGADGAGVTVTLPTMRCVMTTLAQDDLPQDRLTLRTIAQNNRVEIMGFGTWACAGAYADVASPGTVRVGDPVVVG
jgi:hypothetical protein